jgi:hypothetical protein
MPRMQQCIRYFAYGSNMSTRRLSARVADARPLGTGILHGHELRFHKRGRDGSGKCDAYRVEREEARVFGVLFTLPPSAKAALDRFEGLGAGYEEKVVSVNTTDGSLTRAVTYYATDIEDGLLPYCWYKHHVLAGAKEFRLPADYVRTIANVPHASDVNPARRAGEMSIY